MDKQAMVRKFCKKHGFAQDMLKGPIEDEIWHQSGNVRLALIQEELAELAYAWSRTDIVEIADALADLLYTVYGTAVAIGIKIDAVFKEVHTSNMTKEVDDRDIKPRGDTYKRPNIAAVLRKQGIKLERRSK